MKLSLTYPCFWTLLLLLMSNLLLWGDVASVPMCLMRNGRCYISLGEMLDRAVNLSEHISKQAFEMFTEFDSQYAQSQQLIKKNLRKCHTSSLDLPRSRALQTHPIAVLKLVESLLSAWKVPMHHLVQEMPSLKEVPATVLARARDIEEKNNGLLEGVRTILSQIQSGDERNENYPAWSGLASLQSDSEDVHLFAFYNLIRCAGRNAEKVESFLKMTKCKILKQDNC